MKVLITGGAGFIGSHLCEELLARNCTVKVLDDLSTGNMSNLEIPKAMSRFEFVHGSILDVPTLENSVQGVDCIYHMAAAVGVKYVLDNPVNSLIINSKGTENVLNAAVKGGGVKVVLASSSEVYGKSTSIPFKETDNIVMGSTSVSRWGYACAKALDEFLALAYNQEGLVPIIGVRLFNTVGPRQQGRYGMVMPRFIRQALKNEDITVYGDGEQRRSFTYVKDVVKALSDIKDNWKAHGEIFNIGSTNEISINQLATLVKDILNSQSEIIHTPFSEIYGHNFEEPLRRVPDITKLKQYVAYNPSDDLPMIIREIAKSLMS